VTARVVRKQPASIIFPLAIPFHVLAHDYLDSFLRML